MRGKSKRLLQLQGIAEKWAIRLGLGEWNVNVLWATVKESRDCLGLNYWHTEEALCTIKIARTDRDKEATIVHELIHLALEGHHEPTDYDAMYERGINRISYAFVDLDRPEAKQ